MKHYSITVVAQLSGVTVRTLRFYDEIGLLKPAYVADSGYRYYQEKQLLLLQQILFFRELGFALKDIQKIVNKSDFDRLQVLCTHKKVLQQKIDHLRELVQTVDKTVNHMQGKKMMDEKEIFYGFNSEKQARYEQMLVEQYGEKVQETLEESRNNVKNWTTMDWQKSSQEFDAICKDLAALLTRGVAVDSDEVQAVIHRHYNWLKAFWTPNKESYAGRALGYTQEEWLAVFAPYHPELGKYLAEGMMIFAENNL